MAKKSLTGLSLTELQSEIRKREKRVNGLMNKRAAILKQLQNVDAEIASYGGAVRSASGRMTGRKRPKNDSNLADALVNVLRNKVLSVTDVAQAVQKAGYITTSPNFRTIVNQTLLKDKRIKKISRGKYTAKGGSADTGSAASGRARRSGGRGRKPAAESAQG